MKATTFNAIKSEPAIPLSMPAVLKLPDNVKELCLNWAARYTLTTSMSLTTLGIEWVIYRME